MSQTEQIHVQQLPQYYFPPHQQQGMMGPPQQVQMIPQQGYPSQAYVPPQMMNPLNNNNMVQSSGSLIDQIFGPNRKIKVKQRVEPYELLTGFETENKYDVHFENGFLAVALEESDCCARQYCGPKRPFTMHIALKQNGQEFLTLNRPYCHFLHELDVYDTSTKDLLGKVELRCSLFSRELNIFDPAGEKMFDIVSPCCECWTFHIEKNGNRVGEIRKKWSGFIKEAFTDADNFGIEFPADAKPTQKAVLLGALFLIDFLYFETSEEHDKNSYY